MGRLSATTASATYIRWMIRKDLDQVVAIDGDSFAFPWPAGDYENPPPDPSFVHALRKRNSIGMVLDGGDRIAGFMIYDLHKHHIEIARFAVAADMRRTGVGTAMIEKLKAKLSDERRRRLVLDVDELNLPAQLFLRDCGFRCTQITPGDAPRYRFQHRRQRGPAFPLG